MELKGFAIIYTFMEKKEIRELVDSYVAQYGKFTTVERFIEVIIGAVMFYMLTSRGVPKETTLQWIENEYGRKYNYTV